MDHISDALIRPITKLIKKNNTKEKDTDSKLCDEAIALVDSLFGILSEHVKYFRLNKINYHANYLKSKREWVKTFQANNVTKEQVSIGVDVIRKAATPFDDLSPSEFMRLFKGKSSPAYHKEYESLSNESSTRECALKHLSDLKKSLR